MPKKLSLIPMTFLLFLSAPSSASQGSGNSESETMAGKSHHQLMTDSDNTEIKTPRVPFRFGVGMNKFRTLCSSCHGKWGGGTDQGPPLMHPFYKPSHHSDTAFYRAALNGVMAHHWHFGNMPPVKGATAKDIDQVLPFIRWLQRENGID